MDKKNRARHKGKRRNEPRLQQRSTLVLPQAPSSGGEQQKGLLPKQKALLRKPAELLSPEDVAFIRRDLKTIAILSPIMFAVIIVLAFMLGIE